MRYITAMLKLSLTFKNVFLFFYFTLVFPKYYIICLSGDDCLKMKEANIHSLSVKLPARLNLAFLQKKKKKNRGKKNLQLLEHICHSRRVVIDPDGGAAAEINAAKMKTG